MINLRKVLSMNTPVPLARRSRLTGTLKTFVGAQVIASNDRSFRFRWSRRGLSLALTGFEQLPDPSQKD